MPTHKKEIKPNPFVKKAEAAPPPEILTPKPRAKRTPKKSATIIQQAILEIIEGRADDEILALTEAIGTRRDVIREKLNTQVKAIFGDDFEISNQKVKPRAVQSVVDEGDTRDNEVKAEGFAAEGLPDLSMGFGAPSIYDGGSVTAATDPLGGMSEAGSPEITTVGAVIG